MAKWANIEEWRKLCSGETCPIYLSGKPTHILVELTSSYLTCGEDGAVTRGYCCLVFKRHVVDIHDLSAGEATKFMRDVWEVSRALKHVTGAIKMNYEIHGNTIPHLHMHFYPRYAGDPFEGGGIDWRLARKPTYRPGEFAEFARQLLEALKHAEQVPPEGRPKPGAPAD